MKSVEPQVFMIENKSDLSWVINEIGVQWNIPDVSFHEALAEFAGRLCYESWPNTENLNITKIREGNKEYVQNVLKQKHGSIFEHGNLVFLFYNVSRIFTHELVRHRAGSAFSQTSGRYVRLRDIKFWIPDCINDNPAARSVFLEALAYAELAQEKLEKIFERELNSDFNKKKELTSAFRRIAPAGAANNILWSTNHRALRHIISQRCSPHAEVEIREVFQQVAVIMKEKFPNIYADLREDFTFEYDKV